MARACASSVGLVAMVAACGGGTGKPDAALPEDAAPAVDAGQDGDAGLQECSPRFEPWGRTIVDERNFERAEVWYEMTVTGVGPGSFELFAPPVLRDDLIVEVTFPAPTDQDFDLFDEGDTVLVKGGTCWSGTNSGYVRVADLEGEIIWEGGDPYCDEFLRRFYLGLDPISGSPLCWYAESGHRPSPECCCQLRTDWQVVLMLEDPPEPVAPGERTIVTIGGRRYFVASQGGYETADGPCTYDYTAIFGSAFLARLAE